MTVDQRLEFLLQSTESLHATVQQMTGQIQEMTGQMQQVTGQIQEHTKQLEVDAANIRSLANIAAAHQARFENIEGGNKA